MEERVRIPLGPLLERFQACVSLSRTPCGLRIDAAQVAEEMSFKDSLVAALRKIKIASIGPVTSEALGEYGIRANLEPSHPKMGFLVREAAELKTE